MPSDTHPAEKLIEEATLVLKDDAELRLEAAHSFDTSGTALQEGEGAVPSPLEMRLVFVVV